MPPSRRMPLKVSALARTLGVSPQTVRDWTRKLGIIPCATPRPPLLFGEAPNKTARVVWALTPEDAQRLITAFRSK